jgi:hypothetical protein
MINNLTSIYLGCLPFLALLLNHYLGYVAHPVLPVLCFYYSMAIFNFICGYHWSLSMTLISAQARIASLALSFLSVIPALFFYNKHHQIASFILITFVLGQLIVDTRSDISSSIPVSYRVARFIASSTLIVTLFFIVR